MLFQVASMLAHRNLAMLKRRTAFGIVDDDGASCRQAKDDE
jgi:hypothetical protein